MGYHKLQNSYSKVAYHKKEETGSTNSFELRLWDSRIGRWMSPDPYGQYHSPYLGMGNNPISNVDPDGGLSYPPESNPMADALSEIGVKLPKDFGPGWYGGYGNGESVYNRSYHNSSNSLLNIIVNSDPSFEMMSGLNTIKDALDKGASVRGMDFGQNYIDFSMKYDKKLKYKQSRPLDLSDSFTDCSEWCYTVLKYTSPNLAGRILKLGNGNVNTTVLKNYIISHGGFRKTNPKVGDLVMWGGHVEFVKEVTANKHFTVHGAGGGTNNPVPRTQGQSKNGYIWLSPTYKRINTYAAGNFLGFWTPR